jgi:xanthine dehydrogenase large subunit
MRWSARRAGWAAPSAARKARRASFAAIAALLAAASGRAVKLRLDRDDDMLLTGKRHDFRGGLRCRLRCRGSAAGARSRRWPAAAACRRTFSGAINDRAMFHADNCLPPAATCSILQPPAARPTWSSATAFRGFGGPQGMLAIETGDGRGRARHLRLDPLDVRRRNFYGPGRDTTHYGMTARGQRRARRSPRSSSPAPATRARRRRWRAFNAAASLCASAASR